MRGIYKEYGNGDDTTRLEFTPASFKVITYLPAGDRFRE